MTLPESLETLLTIMLARMNRHPQNTLQPHHRWTIYQALGADRYTHGGAIGWLAVLTARRVLPIWEESQPDFTIPGELIALSADVLRGVVNPNKAREEWQVAARQIGVGTENEPENEWLKGLELSVIFAARACLYAVREVVGPHPFELSELELVDETSDGDINPLHMDTAGWAATAVSWPVWIDAPDDPGLTGSILDRRREFWAWWLTDAVNDAWRKGNK